MPPTRKKTPTTSVALLRPSLIRSSTLPFNQVINDCLVKSHAKLLSNYFCNILRINNPKEIGQISSKFDILLSKYSVNEIDQTTGKKTTVKGYGGYISDVIGKLFIHIKKTGAASLKELLKIFTKDQIQQLRNPNIKVPDILIEDNMDEAGAVVNPGSPHFIKTIDEFIKDAHKHPDDTTHFVTYFAIEFLLTPSFFYWMARLDNIVDKSDLNGYVPDADLLKCIDDEISNVTWDGEKYVNNADPNANILQTYLINNHKDPNEADQYKGYPGHSSIIKGVGKCNGEDCLLMQNSWGSSWNASFCGARPISRRVLDKVVYGAIMIAPDLTGFGITKTRKLKSNKNKKKLKRGTRKNRI